MARKPNVGGDPNPPAKEPEKPAEEAKPDQKSDFEALASSLVSGITGALAPMFDELRASRQSTASPASPVAPSAPDFGFPTEAEWAAAEEEGDHIKLSRLSRRESRALAKQGAWQAEQSQNAFAAQVAHTGSRLAIGQVTKEWDLYNDPEFPEIKKTTDELIASLDPAARTIPEHLQTCYEVALGRNAKKLATRERERGIRQDREEAVNQPGRHGREHARDYAPDVDVESMIGGEDGRRAIQALNSHPKLRGDFDRLAKGMGYKDGADYAKRFGGGEA